MKKFIVKVVEYSFAVLVVFWEEFIDRIMVYGLILFGLFWIHFNMNGFKQTFELPVQNESVGGMVCDPILKFSAIQDHDSGAIETITSEANSQNGNMQLELEFFQNSLVTVKPISVFLDNITYESFENDLSQSHAWEWALYQSLLEDGNFSIITNMHILTAVQSGNSNFTSLNLNKENGILVFNYVWSGGSMTTLYYQCNKADPSTMSLRLDPWRLDSLRLDLSTSHYRQAPKACGSWGVPALGEMVRDPRFGLFKLDPYLVISNNQQEPIWATADGFVEIAHQSYSPYSGLGNYVVIDHGNGIKSRYAHAEKLYVNEGDFVKQGQAIGMMGLSGDNFEPSDYSVRYECFDGEEKISPFNCLSSSFLRTIDGSGLEDEVCLTDQEG